MNYIKAKYMVHGVPKGRAYTFKTEDNVSSGDVLITKEGKHVMATDESVDMEWIKAYGTEKIAIVKKVEVEDGRKEE